MWLVVTFLQLGMKTYYLLPITRFTLVAMLMLISVSIGSPRPLPILLTLLVSALVLSFFCQGANLLAIKIANSVYILKNKGKLLAFSAATCYIKGTMFLLDRLKSYGFPILGPPTIYKTVHKDNQSAQAIASDQQTLSQDASYQCGVPSLLCQVGSKEDVNSTNFHQFPTCVFPDQSSYKS